MVLLQEAMGAGPYILILLVIILAGFALVFYVISFLIKYNKKDKKLNSDLPDENNGEYKIAKKESIIKWSANSFLVVFLTILVWGLVSLLKWGCSWSAG